METSSADLWNQFLATGAGSRPIVVGYENQILEFAYKEPQEYDSVKDDLFILYSTPTVWSSHIFIALNENGRRAITALTDDKVQRIAWEHHGFRTGVSGGTADVTKFGVPAQVTQIISMPSASVMTRIIGGLR